MEMEYGYTFGNPASGEDYRSFATFEGMADSIRREPLQNVIENIAKSNMRDDEILKLCFKRMSNSDVRHLLQWAQEASHGRKGGDHSFWEDAANLKNLCELELDYRNAEQE